MAYKNVDNIIIENARIISEISKERNRSTIVPEAAISVSSSKTLIWRRN